MKEELKELVNTDVFDKVSVAGKLYGIAERINDRMDVLDKTQLTMQEKVINQWSLKFEINHMNAIHLTEMDELSGEIWEAITQFMALLEAIHYSERKQTIIDFNNSLKKADNGSSTEK